MNRLAGEVIATGFDGWSDELRQEFIDNADNTTVGSILLSENDRVKVWHIQVRPGERLPVHRHILDYFWTALRAGDSIQHTDDGTTRAVSYCVGDTRHYTFPGDSYLLHDLCNTGTEDLEFITVEHKR